VKLNVPPAREQRTCLVPCSWTAATKSGTPTTRILHQTELLRRLTSEGSQMSFSRDRPIGYKTDTNAEPASLPITDWATMSGGIAVAIP